MPRRRSRRPGVTLLELLIAIALLVALAAIALPSLLTDLDERAFVAAVDVTHRQLLLARAHAQTTGRSVELVFDARPSRVEARLFDPARLGVERDEASEFDVDIDAVDDDDLVIHESWAYRELPVGVQVTRPAPDGVESAGPVRLAVYLADGSALFAPPFWIVDHAGRRRRVTVNPWTGVPNLEAEPSPDDRDAATDTDSAADAATDAVDPEDGVDPDDGVEGGP